MIRLVTRCFHEAQYLDYFINHYLNLGVDEIYIINICNSDLFQFQQKGRVKILNSVSGNNGDQALKDFFATFLPKHKSHSDFILNIDCDEFLFLNKRYSDLKDFINQNQADVYFFNWINVHNISNHPSYLDIKLDLHSDLNFFRANHVKTMIRNSTCIRNLGSHFFYFKDFSTVYSNGFKYKNICLDEYNPFYYCNIPTTTPSYTESALVHLHCRSIENYLIKTFSTVFPDKKSNFTPNQIIENLKSDFNKISDCCHFLKSNIGSSWQLLFAHETPENLINKSELIDLNFPINQSLFCDTELNDETIRKVLNINKINLSIAEFRDICNKLSDLIRKFKS